MKLWNWCKLRLGLVIVSLHDLGMKKKFSKREFETFYDGELYCPICKETKHRAFYDSSGAIIGFRCNGCKKLIGVGIEFQNLLN